MCSILCSLIRLWLYNNNNNNIYDLYHYNMRLLWRWHLKINFLQLRHFSRPYFKCGDIFHGDIFNVAIFFIAIFLMWRYFSWRYYSWRYFSRRYVVILFTKAQGFDHPIPVRLPTTRQRILYTVAHRNKHGKIVHQYKN